jgi:transcriptional regulator with XRE-family HTH domain
MANIDNRLWRVGSLRAILHTMDPRLPNSVQVGRAIRKKREEVPDLSIEALALSAGISTSYLSDIERKGRKFSWEVLSAIIEALGVELDDLITVARVIPPDVNSAAGQAKP